MKKIYTLFLLLLVFSSCSKDDEIIVNRFKSIQVFAYEFNVPEDFTVEYLQGADSSLGRIIGPEYTLEFDFGFWGPGPNFNPSTDFFDFEEEPFGNHIRQIAIAKNPETHSTVINFYNSEIQPTGFLGGSEGYIGLFMNTTSILTEEQQNDVVEILRSGRLY